MKANRDDLTCFYLAPSKITIEECNSEEEKCIVRGVVPIPIRSLWSDVIVSSLQSALRLSNDGVAMGTSQSLRSWNGAVITDRDRGVFDNLSDTLKRLNLVHAKKPIFERLKLKKGVAEDPTPYHSLLSAVEKETGLRVTGLILEVADAVSEVSLSLGAAILFARADVADQWRLTTGNYRDLLSRQRKASEDAVIVDCYLDELFGLHLATQIPVVTSTSLFERISVDGLLEKASSYGNLDMGDSDDEGGSDGNENNSRKEDSDLQLLTPYFDNPQASANWRRQLESIRAKPPKPVPTVSEIRDASTFLKMRVSDKRACLRASGVLSLPRPREGPRKVPLYCHTRCHPTTTVTTTVTTAGTTAHMHESRPLFRYPAPAGLLLLPHTCMRVTTIVLLSHSCRSTR